MTSTSATRTARTRRGEGHASVGAVGQHGGSLPVYICNACGRQVVWATSSKTGRKYLVNVSKGQNDARYYRGDNLHPADCAEQQQTNVDRYAAQAAWERISPNVAAAQLALSAAHRAGEIDDDTLLAALDTIATLFPEGR